MARSRRGKATGLGVVGGVGKPPPPARTSVGRNWRRGTRALPRAASSSARSPAHGCLGDGRIGGAHACEQTRESVRGAFALGGLPSAVEVVHSIDFSPQIGYSSTPKKYRISRFNR